MTNDSEQDAENGVVTLANGEGRKGDLIIAADGVHSRAVKYVVGYDNSAKKSGIAVFRFLLNTEEITDDEEVRHLMLEDGVVKEGVSRFILDGEKRILAWYPCRG